LIRYPQNHLDLTIFAEYEFMIDMLGQTLSCEVLVKTILRIFQAVYKIPNKYYIRRDHFND